MPHRLSHWMRSGYRRRNRFLQPELLLRSCPRQSQQAVSLRCAPVRRLSDIVRDDRRLLWEAACVEHIDEWH